MKKLIPAIVLLLISAIFMSTASFAWFSMNKTVSATGMEVQAVAEDGIVIASYSDINTAPVASDFADTDSTYVSSVTVLHPVFTADAVDWYHASSRMSSNGQAYTSAGYEEVDNVQAVAAVLYADETEYNADKGTSLDASEFATLSDSQKIKTPAVEEVNYYQLNKFQIKSTGAAQAVYVSEIVVVDSSDDSAPDQDYSPALRVLVKSGDATLIFAPLNPSVGASETILATTGASDDVTSDITATIATVNTLGAKILNDVGMIAEDVEIYLYFDGEDVNCKSDNIVNPFEHLLVSVSFTTITPNE